MRTNNAFLIRWASGEEDTIVESGFEDARNHVRARYPFASFRAMYDAAVSIYSDDDEPRLIAKIVYA